LSCGFLVGALAAGGIAYVLTKRGDGESKEADDEAVQEDAAPEPEEVAPAAQDIEAESKAADAQALLQVIAQKVAQEVGPKLSKGGAIRNALEARMSSFQDKAKNLLMNEMNSTAGEVLKELDAPETMLLLDWNNAVESNLPPASIMIALSYSPSFSSAIRMLIVFWPGLTVAVAVRTTVLPVMPAGQLPPATLLA